MTNAAVAPTRPSPAPGAGEYFALLQGLSRRIVDDATGRSLPPGTRVRDVVRDRLWLGMLSSETQLAADAAAGRVNTGRVPPAQGFSFRVPTLPVQFDLTVEACAYLPLHPTVAEQREAVTGTATDGTDGPAGGTGPAAAGPGGAGGTAGGGTAAGGAAGGGTGQGLPLTPTWAKVSMAPVTVRVSVDETSPAVVRTGEDELAHALRTALRPPSGATSFRPRRLDSPVGQLPRDHDLLDEVTWDRYAATNLVDLDDLVLPKLRAAVRLEIIRNPDHVEILATVVNTSPALEDQLFDGRHPYPPRTIDLQLYEVVLTADLTGPLLPYELEQVAQSYRYQRTVPAFGHACPVQITTLPAGAAGQPGGTRLQTLFAAEQRTDRVRPRTLLELPGTGPVPLDTSFASLSSDPVGTVVALVDAHAAWVDHHWSTSELDRLQATLGWDAAARAEADVDAVAARAEVDWVRAGLDLLRTDPRIREAFVLANRAVAAAAASSTAPYTAWHPFQVAWIVGCLPGLADPGAHLDVDIVWFSTGGGKSEAYLGLMAATLFYGRLTGVTAGAQVWARFPLRLLALQQTERFASIVFHAEILRRDHPDLRGGDPFGVGYFVGGGNTPNKLYPLENRFSRGLDPAAATTAEACRVLQTCPVCHGPVQIHFDEPSWTMRHVCGTAGCPMVGVLPVWGIDDEIYRHAPAVLVGTVDKLAQLGQSTQFQTLLGRAHSRCPRHGYSGNPQWCAVFGCQEPRQPVPGRFGSVRLEIADELHLLEESLGALDGMYETLLQAISDGLGNDPIRVVGATATIEGYQNQVAHLYHRTGRRFPVNGPVAGETFWATTVAGDPLRSYLGVRPRTITMVTATREVALTHARWLADLRTNPDSVLTNAGLDPTDPTAADAARRAWSDLYEVLVAYCLRNEDLTSFTRDPEIQDLLGSMANLAVINGDTEPATIRASVQRLVDPPTADAGRVKIVAATKSIGHGFDVARLGVMVAMGTPTQAAEVIQASARVGRRHPGLVVHVVNPTRDRDASVYRYYADWIRFLDRLVHKVPVNRESLPVLRRVLSGGLMAWLLQVHDRGWITGGRRRKTLGNSAAFAAAIDAGYLTRDLLVDNLTAAFGIDPTSVYHQMHRDTVAAWVEQQLVTLPMSAAADKRLPELLHPPVPMSLRDIEEPITLYGNL
jgi:hypothetical protein